MINRKKIDSISLQKVVKGSRSVDIDKYVFPTPYVIDISKNDMFNTNDDDMILDTPFVDVLGNVVKLDELRVGDVFFTTDNSNPNRFLKSISKANMPDGYTLIDTLYATGGQYIDTLINPFENIKCETKIHILGKGGNGLFGVGGDNSWGTYMGRDVMWDNYNDDHGVSISSGFQGLLYIRKDGKYTQINNDDGSINIEFSRNKVYPSDTRTIRIFSKHGRGAGGSMKVYYFNLLDADGNYIFKGIPAMRNEDSALGLFDEVTQTFFTNAGSGSFTKTNTLSIQATLSKITSTN